MNDTKIEALVDKAKTGNEDAFGRLVKMAYPSVVGVSLSVVKNSAAAEDLAQETFLVAWRRLDTLKRSRRFRIWLLRIARNLSLNWLRSESYRRRLLQKYGENATELLHPKQEHASAMSDKRQELERVLDRLSPSVREAVVLYYVHGASAERVAEQLAISASAVRKRLERGRKALRSALEDKWREEIAREQRGRAAAAVQRIRAGLGGLPAATHVGSESAGNGIGLLMHHIQQNGLAAAIKPLTVGGLAMTGKQLSGIMVVLALALALVLMMVEPNHPADTRDAPEVVPIAGNATPEPEVRTRDAADITDATSAQTATPEEPVVSPQPESDPPELHSRKTSRERVRKPPENKTKLEAASIRGIVVDEWDNPIAGARVTVVPTGVQIVNMDTRIDYLTAIADLDSQHHTVSTADGEFHIPGITRFGQATVQARVQNGHGRARVGLVPGQDLDDTVVVVKAGVPLNGRLLTQNGYPIAGAMLSSMTFVAERMVRGGSQGRAYSDQDGYFQLIFGEKGSATIQAVSADRGKNIFEALPVGDEAPIDIVWKDPGTLYGLITRQDGSPAKGVEIILKSMYRMSTTDASGKPGASVSTAGPAFKQETDDDGAYRVAGIPAGLNYEVYVRDGNGEALCIPESLGAFESGETKTWDHILGAGFVLSGRVEGAPTGRPLAEIEVSLIDSTTETALGQTRTGADGRFEIKVPDIEGTCVLSATHRFLPLEHRNRAFDQVVTIPPADDQEFVLYIDDPFGVEFLVSDPDGAPLKGASINPNWTLGRGSHGWHSIGETDVDGRFRWGGAAPLGTYRFRVLLEHYASMQSMRYEGAPGHQYPPETIVLYPLAGVEGILLDGEGNPWTNAEVRLSAYIGGERITSHSAPTDTNGYFILREGIPGTTISLEVRVGEIKTRIDSVSISPGMIADIGAVQLSNP